MAFLTKILVWVILHYDNYMRVHLYVKIKICEMIL